MAAAVGEATCIDAIVTIGDGAAITVLLVFAIAGEPDAAGEVEPLTATATVAAAAAAGTVTIRLGLVAETAAVASGVASVLAEMTEVAVPLDRSSRLAVMSKPVKQVCLLVPHNRQYPGLQ